MIYSSLRLNLFKNLLVDSINAGGSITTGIAVALVHIDLTIHARCAWRATTPIPIHQILTMASILAGI
jgi:hypothetical protein